MSQAGIAAASGAAASPAPAAPPPNEVGYANLALTQMLTLSDTGAAITADGSQFLAQVWDQVYLTDIPPKPGFSSPYLLRAHGTSVCLQDVGEGHTVIAAECETTPALGSRQLWQNHHAADRTVGSRDYFYRFNHRTGDVLTARPTSPAAENARVVSAQAQPISQSGAANHQLWLQLESA